MYYGYENLKNQSSMGYHCDNTYNDKGMFLHSMNSHVENTPIVILSYGGERTLNWRRVNRSLDGKGKKIWMKDNSFSTSMNMNENSLVVINPFDEKPHNIGNSPVLIKYQHGKVEVKSNQNISFGLVFRVVDYSYCYNPLNNVMIRQIGNMTFKEHLQSLIRKKLYSSSNIEEYHNLLKNKYINKK